MKKIFSSQDVTLVSLHQSILETNGIRTFLKNYYLTGGIGDIPANAVLPELWIYDDEQYDLANSLLTKPIESPWTCRCGERIAGQFAQCWKCGTVRQN